MPINIQPNRPYYPRYYLPRRAPAGRQAAAQAPAGRAAPSRTAAAPPGGFPALDTTPTGSPGGDIIKALGNAIQVRQQNQLANQLLNTQTPPRAAWVGGAAPAAGVSTAGTAPQTGGVAEFNLRQQMDAAAQQANQQALADQLQRAKIAEAWGKARGGGGGGGGGGGSGNASRWMQQGGGQGGGKGGKAAQFVPGQYDVNADSRADNFGQIAADFDNQFGKGTYAKVAPHMATIAPVKDDKGNITGYTVGDPDKPIMTLTPDQANYWGNRINAGNIASGQNPLQVMTPGANPNSGQTVGTVGNPYLPKSGLEIRALPYDSYYQDPNSGQIGQKLRPQPARDQGQKTSDVTDQNAPALAATQPATAPAPAAAPTPAAPANAPVAPAPGAVNAPVATQGPNVAANAPQPPAEAIPQSGGALPPIIPGLNLSQPGNLAGVDVLSGQNASLQQQPGGQLYPQQDMWT